MMPRFLYAVDPGTTDSALVVFDVLEHRVLYATTESNQRLLERLSKASGPLSLLVVEQIEAMGMAVGRETFETVWWSGRFHQVWRGEFPERADAQRVTRREVKLHLCGSMRAKDANIRQAILDRFGGSAAKGTKASPGPLYGVKGHEFAALAVAVTFIDTRLPGGQTHERRDSDRSDSRFDAPSGGRIPGGTVTTHGWSGPRASRR